MSGEKLKGTFIVIEGIDGAGKSTQAEMLAQKLEEDHEVYLTQEPSESSVGNFIREEILGNEANSGIIDGETLDPKSEVLLFSSDRAEHCKKIIESALEEGKIVVSDRYVFSTYAYQAAREDIDLEWLREVNSFTISPDLVVLLDLPVKEGLKRLDEDLDTIESVESIQHKARDNYMDLSEEYDEIKVVDGKKSIDKVHDDIYKLVKNFLKKKEEDEQDKDDKQGNDEEKEEPEEE